VVQQETDVRFFPDVSEITLPEYFYHVSYGKKTSYRAPIARFPYLKNPAKRPDFTLNMKSHIWGLFDKITFYIVPTSAPKAA
jgi:energy-converting hydrogenase Eha subunit F